jgi:hypothetical protein
MQGDENSIAHVRQNNNKAARSSLFKEGPVLDVG